MKVNLVDIPLFTKTLQEKQSLPLSHLLSIFSFFTIHTHTRTLTPLWPLALLIGPTTFRWKAGFRWPFFPLSTDASALSREMRTGKKNKPETDAWELFCFITLLNLALILGPQVGKIQRRSQVWYPARCERKWGGEGWSWKHTTDIPYKGDVADKQLPIYTFSRHSNFHLCPPDEFVQYFLSFSFSFGLHQLQHICLLNPPLCPAASL